MCMCNVCGILCVFVVVVVVRCMFVCCGVVVLWCCACLCLLLDACCYCLCLCCCVSVVLICVVLDMIIIMSIVGIPTLIISGPAFPSTQGWIDQQREV